MEPIASMLILIVMNAVQQSFDLTWAAIIAVVGAAAVTLWKLAGYGAQRKIEKEIVPKIEEVKSGASSSVSKVHTRVDDAVRSFQEALEQSRREYISELKTLELNHSKELKELELSHVRMLERLNHQKEFNESFIIRVNQIDSDLKTEITKVSAEISRLIAEEQAAWRGELANLIQVMKLNNEKGKNQ